MPANDSDFPLITLRPQPDARQVWASLLLCGDPPLSAANLLRILNGYGLATLLADLPCVAGVDAACLTPPAGIPLLPLPPPPHLTLLPAETAATMPANPADPAVAAEVPAAAGQADAPARGLLLKLMTQISADADTDDIEALIKRDPNLSYQLLKLVNSVALSPGRKIASFGQAIAILGRRQLQRWLQLLLYARQPGSAAASPLLPRAALRAGLMEALARRRQWSCELQEHAFMVGMFSLLDQLFGRPLATVIAPLNLADDVVAGLIGPSAEGGEAGQRLHGLLAVTVANEAAPAEGLRAGLQTLGIDHGQWAAAVVEALRWAVMVSKEA